MPKRILPEDYIILANNRGFKWLGPETKNTATKTLWECEKGHRWEATYGNIKYRNSGCPFCAGKAPKTSKDYHILAKENGVEWLGPEVSSVLTKTRWKCEFGHEWEAKYASIQQGYGCPYCAQVVPKDESDYISLAQDRGFQWLGPKVSNTHTLTAWQCKEGHKWEATYANIKHRESNCPFCTSHVPKTAEDYHELASANNITWLGSELPQSVHSKTIWECSNGHKWEGYYANIQGGQGCPICAHKRTATLLSHSPQDYEQLAKDRKFKWLGPEVTNSRSKTYWECPEGHVWKATYNMILRGRGCPDCSGLKPKTAKDYERIAKMRGFKWLGPMVPNTASNTLWECSKGHQWEATYHNIRHSNSDCPYCLDMVNSQLVSKVQRELHELIGGELNLPFENYFIDIALIKDGVKIAVEYDSWYWHAGKEDYDSERDKKNDRGRMACA